MRKSILMMSIAGSVLLFTPVLAQTATNSTTAAPSENPKSNPGNAQCGPNAPGKPDANCAKTTTPPTTTNTPAAKTPASITTTPASPPAAQSGSVSNGCASTGNTPTSANTDPQCNAKTNPMQGGPYGH